MVVALFLSAVVALPVLLQIFSKDCGNGWS